MITRPMILLLADDDDDDHMFFQEALKELELSTKLTLVNDGDRLMDILNDPANPLPHAIFLDINMPRKTGLDCLKEIKSSTRLKELPVIMFSTAFDKELVKSLYNDGVKYYIRKPANFDQLKNVIQQALDLLDKEEVIQPAPEDFVIRPLNS